MCFICQVSAGHHQAKFLVQCPWANKRIFLLLPRLSYSPGTFCSMCDCPVLLIIVLIMLNDVIDSIPKTTGIALKNPNFCLVCVTLLSVCNPDTCCNSYTCHLDMRLHRHSSLAFIIIIFIISSSINLFF